LSPPESKPALPFDGSRRLTGPNLYFSGCGAVLEATSPPQPAQIADWRERVGWACAELGWQPGAVVVRLHRGGAALAFEAPPDQLFAATEVNEWAWAAAVSRPVMHAPGHPAAWDRLTALVTLRALATQERDPALRALLDEAGRRQAPVLWDDDRFSLGLGIANRCWPRAALPEVDDVPWAELAAVPTALVTGSNGKTSTVRLLAACCRAQGWDVGNNCTDGLFFNGELLEGGDYSGPGGARAVLRDPRVQAAVLETARGGILRRGLAFDRADAAIVTNISADHFGEYGIDDLDGLAEAKLVVARGLRADGMLVLNADDALLRRHAPGRQRISWFGLDFESAFLREARGGGCPTCGVLQGRLLLSEDGGRIDLGAVADMPLSLGGVARYNIANLAGAALMALALGIEAERIAAVFAAFGARRGDNPGRLQRWRLDGMDILVDYAHNPEGLEGLLEVAAALRGSGRMGLLLGQAGNRQDDDVRALTAITARFDPERVVLKDIDDYLRDRRPGEVPALLGDELRARGMDAERMVTVLPEFDAACSLLDWGRAGDVLVMPMHARPARTALSDLLDARLRHSTGAVT